MALLANPRKHCRFAIPALLVVLQLAAVSAQAQTKITQCGTFIMAPGQYVLANDLLNCPNFGVIISRANDVVLSLAGHRITGATTKQLAAGIKIQSGSSRVRIQGPGVISGFTGPSACGVLLISGGNLEVTAVTSASNDIGFFLHGGMVNVHGNVATNDGSGFVMASDGEISDNLASGNTQDGIAIERFFSGNVRATHNTVAFNRRYGIYVELDSKGNDITSNTALDNVSYDLFDANKVCVNTWADNSFGSSKGPCIN